MDMNLEMLKLEFEEMNQSFNFSEFYPMDTTFLAHQQQQQLQPQFIPSSLNNFLTNSDSNFGNEAPLASQSISFMEDDSYKRKRRRVIDVEKPSNSLNVSFTTSSTNEIVGSDNNKIKNIVRSNKGGMAKLEEVIHVRAKRGQATDSHSVAERARREKINNKMKCLQDLVPGCHKSMGMAGMLEEIINYVHSLQNQVEFLSMELASASSPYNFGSESIIMLEETISHEQQQMEKWRRDQKNEERETFLNFHST